MAASFTRFAPGAYRSTNLVPVEIHRTGSGKTPWVVCVIGAHARLGTFGYEVARFATLADAKTLALPLIRHPQGVAAAAGWALMAARKLEGFGGHGRAKRHDERMASYLIAWRTFTLASGATVQHFGEAVADDVTATYTLMPARAGGDGGGWVNRVDALEVAVSLTDASPVDFGGSADPCDCGTVRGASGLYVNHVAGGHVDCTGTDAIVAARELARLLGTDVDVTDAARQSEAVRVLEWATEFASDCMWGDVTADDIAGMDADTIIRSAARHYDGGIMAMANDALALPFALRVADAHADQSGRLVNQLQRDAVAARAADNAAGELLERIATRGYAGTRPFAPEVWRDVAEDAADILQDCSALVAARIVRELPTVALRIMLAPIDVNRAELVTATITERELRERADGMLGRGEDWNDAAERVNAAADIVANIAKTARGHMLANEGHYFASAYAAIGELAKLGHAPEVA